MASFASLLTPRASRLALAAEATLESGGGTTAIAIANLTIYGFMALGDVAFPVGAVCVVVLNDGERLPAEVRWSEGGRFGAVFTPPLRTFTLARILAASEAG